MPDSLPADSTQPLSQDELRSLIERHLPAWQRACDATDGDSIVLHETSFGTSADELFLFACAIKYAAAKGKHVHVAAGTGKAEQVPEMVVRSAALGKVYRETTASSRRPTADRAKRGARKKKRF
jgi:hypothetical protein